VIIIEESCRIKGSPEAVSPRSGRMNVAHRIYRRDHARLLRGVREADGWTTASLVLLFRNSVARVTDSALCIRVPSDESLYYFHTVRCADSSIVPYGFSLLDATNQKTLVTRLLPVNSAIKQFIQILTTDIASESGNKAPLLGDEAPLLGNKAPLLGNKAPPWGNKAPPSGSKAPPSGSKAPLWGNKAPLWG